MLIGSFYFERTTVGNLIGEFANNFSDYVMTETANPQKQNQNYIGTYDSTWYDDDAHHAKLVITQKPGTHNKIFILKWIEGVITTFEGEGFLYRDTLIGHYVKL